MELYIFFTHCGPNPFITRVDTKFWKLALCDNVQFVVDHPLVANSILVGQLTLALASTANTSRL